MSFPEYIMAKLYSFLLPSLLLLLYIMNLNTAHATEIRAVTSNFAPLQMKEDGKLDGYTVLIVNEVLNRLKDQRDITNFQIDLLPWKHAMRLAEQKENTIFFSISRTESREEKFQWISEISPYEIYLYKLKSKPLPELKTLKEAPAAKILLSAQIGSNLADLYKNLGLQLNTNYVEYNHYSNGIPMLFGGRFDVIPLTSFVARANTCALGYDGNQIEKYFYVEEISKPLWLVASLGTAPKLVKKMQNIISDLREEGFIQATQSKFISKWDQLPCEATN